MSMTNRGCGRLKGGRPGLRVSAGGFLSDREGGRWSSLRCEGKWNERNPAAAEDGGGYLRRKGESVGRAPIGRGNYQHRGCEFTEMKKS